MCGRVDDRSRRTDENRMNGMTLRKIADAIGGQLFAEGCEDKVDIELTGVVIDNRLIQEDNLFIPIRGARVDGHTFIPDAFSRGALGVLTDHKFEGLTEPFILVDDTEQALKAIAKYYRQCMEATVIGIVGSVGKTSTKEMVASVLEQHFSVLKTEGNYNNEIGVPLTLLRVRRRHTIAVVEMGISDFGEMDRLGRIAAPNMVIFTNVGPCHLENLGSLEGVLRAKSEIFSHVPLTGRILLNGDDVMLRQADTYNRVKNYFGTSGQEFAAEDIVSTLDGVDATLIHENRKHRVHINLPGEHNVLNALAAYAAGYFLGEPEEEILRGIEAAGTIEGRNHFINVNDLTIIDDCYNANPISMRASLEVLSHAAGRKVAILGDMGELGSEEVMLHEQIGKAVIDDGIDVLLTAGPLSKGMVDYVGSNASIVAIAYDTKEELITSLPENIKKGDTILVKASHFMGFSEIVKYLTATEEGSDSQTHS